MRSVWVLLGLVLLAIAGFACSSAVDAHDAKQLERRGVHTTGVVISMEKFGCSGKRGAEGVNTIVRFEVDGREHDFPFNASCGAGLFVGAVVPIVYNPNDPSSFTVNHATSIDRLTAGLLLLSGLVAFPSAIIGFVLFLEKRKIRSMLKQTRWVRTTCVVTKVKSGGGRFAVEIWTNEGPSAFLATDFYSRVLRKFDAQELLIAGNGNTARVIRQPDGRRLLMVKRSAKTPRVRRTAGQSEIPG